MNFEKQVIDKILNTIKKHQVYLTQPENLPQLAKLGYMYNTLWYHGRVAWGGVIKKHRGYVCQDNPKYKIEMCEPENEQIEDLIYDAWGMHVSNDGNESWEKFYQNVVGDNTPSELEILEMKPNKTMDEWVALYTREDYRYRFIFPNRSAVLDYLLCTIGTGMGYKDGYIFSEASGADQDITLYGYWQGAKFSPEIQKVVDKIMTDPITKQTVDAAHGYILKLQEERKAKEKNFFKNEDDYEKFLEILGEKKEKTYSRHYPICEYSLITKLNKDSHPSYIAAAIEVCEEILAHPKEEERNLKIAKKILNKFKNETNS